MNYNLFILVIGALIAVFIDFLHYAYQQKESFFIGLNRNHVFRYEHHKCYSLYILPNASLRICAIFLRFF